MEHYLTVGLKLWFWLVAQILKYKINFKNTGMRLMQMIHVEIQMNVARDRRGEMCEIDKIFWCEKK